MNQIVPDAICRPAKPVDAIFIAEIKVAAWKIAYAGLLPQDSLDALDPLTEAPHWRSWLEDETAGLSAFVVEQDGQILGYAFGGPMRMGDRPEQDEISADSEIYAIYVHPDHQRRKLGKKLLCALTHALTEQGFNTLGLWMMGGNQQAEAFCASFGGAEAKKRVEIRNGRIAFREKAWLWPDLKQLRARLSLQFV